MNIGIDIDGCLANFNEKFADLLIKTAKADLFPPGWRENQYTEWPTVWYYPEAAGYDPETIQIAWQKVMQSTTFWYSLDPMPGAEATLKQLNRLSKMGHNVYFITHRMGDKAKSQTEAWLSKYGMTNPTVLISGTDKLPLIVGLGIELYVDDKLETVEQIYNMVPSVKVCLFNAPYNQDSRDPVQRINSFEDILRALELWHDERRGRPRKSDSTRQEFLGVAAERVGG